MQQPGQLHPEPLPLRQATADPYLCRKYSNTQKQVWLSLCGVFWCTQGFVWAFWDSLAGMGFDSKCDCTPPTILLGLLLCPWTWGISFWWYPTFSFDGFSAMSFKFGVLTGDECTSSTPPSCRFIKPVNPKGNQSWIYIGRTDAEAPILWPLDAKNWLLGKDPDTG